MHQTWIAGRLSGRMCAQIAYESSMKNRTHAIEVHGTTCIASDFDFNTFYGESLAGSFIDIHNRQFVATLDGRQENVETDLVPLCASCHRMVHSNRGTIMPVE